MRRNRGGGRGQGGRGHLLGSATTTRASYPTTRGKGGAAVEDLVGCGRSTTAAMRLTLYLPHKPQPDLPHSAAEIG